MNTPDKGKAKSAKGGDRMEQMDQKLDLLLKKVSELQAELDRLNAHYKPLIN